MDRRSILLGGTLLIGTTAVASSQTRSGVARVGVLMDLPPSDPSGIARVAALMEGLGALGWKVGSSLAIDIRWGSDNREQMRRDAGALIAAGVEVVVTSATPPTREMHRLTRTIPIVFTTVIDPVGAGFVESLSRPGGNVTGFSNFEPSLAGKWVEILLEVDPRIRTVATITDPGLRASELQSQSIAHTARRAGKGTMVVDLSDDAALQAAFSRANAEGVGVIVTSSPSASTRRFTIINLARRYRVPTVYPGRHHAAAGGLISYGPDLVEPFRHAASYVHRILRGEHPSQLPVQLPTRFETVVNLRTAREMDLQVGNVLLARADEIIE